MEAQKHSALHALYEGNDRLNDLQSKFTDKYGTNDINITTGALNYSQDESSNS